MNLIENVDIEFKRQIVESIKKEVIAFANSEGGTIYIGIDTYGSVTVKKSLSFCCVLQDATC